MLHTCRGAHIQKLDKDLTSDFKLMYSINVVTRHILYMRLNIIQQISNTDDIVRKRGQESSSLQSVDLF